MSPHIKRTAVGGLVVGVTSLLVLSAIAVAQRDSRNMEGDAVSGSPEYAQQEVQPLAIPAGMISSRRFPHADLASDISATSESLSQARAYAPPSLETFGSASSSPNEPNNEPTQNASETALKKNPLRIPHYQTIGSEHTLENEESTSAEELNSSTTATLAETSSEVQDAAYESGSNEHEVAIDHNSSQDGVGSQVVTASGYGIPPATDSSTVPPSNATAGPSLSSGTPLAPPSLPPINSRSQLSNPGVAAPKLPNYESISSQSTGAPATLLPPTSATSSNGPGAFPTIGSPPPLSGSLPPSASLGAPSTLPSSSASAPRASSPPSASLQPPVSNNSMPAASANGVYGQAVPSTPASYPNQASLSDRKLTSPSATNPSDSYPSLDNSAALPGNASPAINQSGRMVPISRASSAPSSFNDRASIPLSNEFISDQPGERTLDGVQTPNLQIVKQAPAEIQVGHPATFTILVKNVGKAPAHDVVVQDVLPQGTNLQSTNPPAQLDGSQLFWKLGTVPVGAQQVLTVEAIPEQEGEIGSIATVQFTSQASVRTMVTQPKLVVSQQADPSVLIGEKCRVRITVSNDGTGVAYDVRVEEDVPQGFKHPQGDILGLPLNDLAPGQSRTFDLELEATEPGIRTNKIRVVSSNTQEANSEVQIDVVAPQITVKAEGPGLRYLERQATYNVSVKNVGTATARKVELIAHLPRGLKFSSAGNGGEYLADQHAVIWGIEELAAGTEAKTDLVVMPVEPGDFVLRFQSRAERSAAQPFEKQVRVDGQSELTFTVEDDNDPIEVDKETTYVVRLNNIGTRQDSNVVVAVKLPPNATVASISAPVEYQQRENHIVFAPIPTMKPKDEVMFRFSVALNSEGTQMVSVAVKSDLRPVEVVKEESTQVYRDQ